MEHINLLYGYNVEFLNVKVDRIKNNHYVLKGQNLPLFNISA
jgi:hypothetical protein